MKPTNLNLLSLFHEGCKELHKGYEHGELAKAGRLRAGAGGALLSTGEVVGGCHRKAFARWLGQPSPQPSPMTQSNFDNGYRNEDNWKEKLDLGWKGKILQEEEIPTEWFTSQGIPVGGRPDQVLFENDTPVLVVEHKAVVSLAKAASRWLGEVDASHFIQACHYSMALDTPATIVYSSAIIGMVPWFVPKEKRPLFWPKGKGWEVKPFKKEFRIGRDDAGYYYYVDNSNNITTTQINAEAIKNYYELLVDMRDQKSLYKRHSNYDQYGELISKYRICDYCELSEICDEFEGNFQRWCDEVMKGKQ